MVAAGSYSEQWEVIKEVASAALEKIPADLRKAP